MAWEIIFMLVILKIPIIYLCVVIWWAIKAEPSHPDLGEPAVVADTPPAGGSPWRRRPARPRPTRPHAGGRGGTSTGSQRGGVHA
jgi:hypothetical protein